MAFSRWLKNLGRPMNKRLLLIAITPFLVLFALAALLPAAPAAYAQDPTPTPACVVSSTQVYSFPTLPVYDWYEADAPAAFLEQAGADLCEPDCEFERGPCGLLSNDLIVDQNICDSHECYCAVKLEAEDLFNQVGGLMTQTMTITQLKWSQNDTTNGILTYMVLEWDDDTYTEYYAETYNGWSIYEGFEMETGKTLHAVYLAGFKALSGGTLSIGSPQLWVELCEGGGSGGYCSTVTDFHFAGDPAWILSGASILSSTLILPDGGLAGQNLETLAADRNYSAVVSVTNITNSPLNLLLALGDVTATLEITETGLYTADVSTPAGLSGAILYQIENAETSSDYIADIDYTCLYLGDEEVECLAPENGNFDTADEWNWYRGAAWSEPAQNAFLPYSSGGCGGGLVQTTQSYSLPTLAAGEYLILGFIAGTGGGNSAVGARVRDSWHQFSAYPPFYDYEADISSMAGLSATVSFVNAASSTIAAGNVSVDDVCIFISDRPANPPEQSETSITEPADMGFSFTCDDLSPLLLGYGINTFEWEDTYTTGVSVWDPENYIPWLASALWVNAAKPISCLLIEFMRLDVGLAEQWFNNFTNYIAWNLSTSQTIPLWARSGFSYLTNVLLNQSSSGWTGFGRWFNWYALGIRQTLIYAAHNNSVFVDWMIEAAAEPISGLAASLGDAISQIMTDFSWLWNENFLTYLYLTSSANPAVPAADLTNPDDPWAGVLDMFLWLVNFVGSIVDFVWSIFSWLVNVLFSGAEAPIEAYHNFVAGVSSEAATVDVLCADDNFWCYFWAGVQLINQTASQSVIYPFVIIGLILATAVIVYLNVHELFHINLS